MTDDEPPLIRYSLTMALRASPEGRARMQEAWRQMEERWLDWYERQPIEALTERHHEAADRLLYRFPATVSTPATADPSDDESAG